MKYQIWLPIILCGIFVMINANPHVANEVHSGILMTMIGITGSIVDHFSEDIILRMKYSVEYYLMLCFSAIFIVVTPISFSYYASAADKDSTQGFLGGGGTIIFFALSLILYLYAEERQKDIDTGKYIPPDRKRKLV